MSIEGENEKLFTPKSILRKLGPGLQRILEDLDPYKRRSNILGKIDDASRFCWTCGRKGVDEAHIVPCIEGGLNYPDNIIFLCSRPTKANDDPNRFGCHELYDNFGAISRAELQNIKKNGPDRDARSRMIENVDLARKLNLEVYLKGSRIAKDKTLRMRLQKAAEPAERFEQLTELIDNWRRRPRKDAIRHATKYVDQAKEIIGKVRNSELKSRFYYQEAYVEILKEKLEDAIILLTKSIDEANKAGAWLYEAMSKVQRLVVIGMLMSTSETFGEKGLQHLEEWTCLTDLFNKKSEDARKELQRIKQECRDSDEIEILEKELACSVRFLQNCRIHHARFAVKRKNLAVAKEEMAQYSELRSKLTIADGWVAEDATIATITYGMIAALDDLNPEERVKSTRMLVRGIMMILETNQKGQENIRDGLFALGMLLQQNDLYKDYASRFFEVAANIHDPLSRVMESFGPKSLRVL